MAGPVPVRARPLLNPLMRELLARHASGSTLRQASGEMYVSYSSAVNSVQEIKRRLGSRTLAGCVLRAHCLGYLSAPDHRGLVEALLPEGQHDVGRGG